jgi:Ni,Fe-hydrogenase III small subunit/ferredoxin
MPWALRGLRNGVLTTRYPRKPDPYATEFPAAVAVADGGDSTGAEALCPTGAIEADPDGLLRLDRGRCILCGACVRARPDLFRFSDGTETARDSRHALIVPEIAEGPDDTAALAAMRASLAARVAVLRRSVHIRHVDAGSDGSDEWEIAALTNPVYDVHRLGIFLTASPRHADILLVTGAGARGMDAPLARTHEATARPLVVIAAGADAASGGLISPTDATRGGVSELLDVDVWVPGSPPSPFSLLQGILLALGRVPRARGGEVGP